MGKTMWKTGLCRGDIEPVEVVKETSKMILVNSVAWHGKPQQEHCMKRSSHDNYFDTWKEAKEFLVRGAEVKVSMLKSQLHAWQSRLGQLQSLKEPAPDGTNARTPE